MIIPDSGDGNLNGRLIAFTISEGIDNPRLRGRKLNIRISWDVRKVEGIDNPRLRGRKLHYVFIIEHIVIEGIDNPRLRGRKLKGTK